MLFKLHVLFSEYADIFCGMQQRVKAASSAEHMKVLSMESSNADTLFQQLDKLRMVYEEYTKIGKETIPLAEKNLSELTEELEQKSQALDDVSTVLLLALLTFK
jgi:DNA repair protein RAD50